MASSSHNGKKARPTATAAGSSDVGQDQAGEFLTTAQGLRLPDTDHSLKAGERGPTLLEDFHLREKITHFDHERIPERVVHARGAAAHGTFDIKGAKLLVPGHPEQSIIYHRMTMTGLGRMPHIGSRVVDEQAVKLVGDWIKQMPSQ